MWSSVIQCSCKVLSVASEDRKEMFRQGKKNTICWDVISNAALINQRAGSFVQCFQRHWRSPSGNRLSCMCSALWRTKLWYPRSTQPTGWCMAVHVSSPYPRFYTQTTGAEGILCPVDNHTVAIRTAQLSYLNVLVLQQTSLEDIGHLVILYIFYSIKNGIIYRK